MTIHYPTPIDRPRVFLIPKTFLDGVGSKSAASGGHDNGAGLSPQHPQLPAAGAP